MTSSTSSSSRRLALAAALALASLGGCRHGAAVASAPRTLKLAVFPIQNAAGGKAPIKPLTEALDAALAAQGIDAVPRRDLDAVLAAHRLRYTGGVDRAMATALHEELGAEAVLIPTLEQWSADDPPKVALAMRIVGTSERPLVVWADEVTRAGNDSPGLLRTGIVASVGELEKAVIADATRRVERFLAKRTAAESCGEAGRFRPRRVYRASELDDVGRRTVAVLPFTNQTIRRSADDVLLNQFVAELTRSGSFEVLDPGFVREQLLGHRIVLAGGVSVDAAMALLDLLDADVVVSGYVLAYEARSGAAGTPKVEFSAYALDRRTAELVWSSGSVGDGNDGVFFFDAGRVHTTAALSCRMVRGVVDEMVGDRGRLGPATAEPFERTANAAFYGTRGAVSARRPRSN